jgi:hypothetical protein
VIVPSLFACCSVNQRLPSGPAMMPWSPAAAVGTANFVIAPAVVMRPIWLLPASVNQRLPSGPTAMSGRWPLVVTGNSARTSLPSWLGMTRPTTAAPPPSEATSQTLASGPVTSACGVVDTVTDVAIAAWRQTESMTPRNEPPVQRLPSGPAVIAAPDDPMRSGTMNIPAGVIVPSAGSS